MITNDETNQLLNLESSLTAIRKVILSKNIPNEHQKRVYDKYQKAKPAIQNALDKIQENFDFELNIEP